MSVYWFEKKDTEKKLLTLEVIINTLKEDNNKSNLDHNYFLNLNDNDKFKFIVENNYWDYFHHLSERFIVNNNLDVLIYDILIKEYNNSDNKELILSIEGKYIYYLERIINWITNPDKFIFNIIPPKFSDNFIEYYRKKYFDKIIEYLWFKDLKLNNPFLTKIELIDNFPRRIYELIYEEEWNKDKLNKIDFNNLFCCIIMLREDADKILKKFNVTKMKLKKDVINSNGYFKFKIPNISKNHNYIKISYNYDLIDNDESNSEILFSKGSFLWKVKRVWDQL